MGHTKQYLRYVPAGSFNIIASPSSNATFVTFKGQEGRFVAVAACENVIIWDLRLSEKALVLEGEKHVVTAVAVGPSGKNLSVGYSDGTVKMFQLESPEDVIVFAGHRSAVTCLAYDTSGHRLASGAKDTDIIVWDVIAEAGLQRLTGHTGNITQLVFMKKHNILVSSSKDSYVKLWDLDTWHCFKTIVGHRSEVWSFALVKSDKYLVTGCNDNELRVWHITEEESDESTKKNPVNIDTTGFTEELEAEINYPIQCKKVGSILRKGKGRVQALVSDPSGEVLGCHSNGALVELFYFCGDGEVEMRLKKRMKKEKKKMMKQSGAQEDQQPATEDVPASLQDEVRRLSDLKAGGFLRSMTLIQGKGELRVCVVLKTNSIELHTVQMSIKGAEAQCVRQICQQGHRSEVRTVTFSSDNLAILSGSSESVKMWNRPTLSCLRTVETGYVLSAVFVPGDRHAIVGLNNGILLVIDIATGDKLEEIQAHSKEVWALCLLPDQRGIISGSGDATVKLWDFELISDPESPSDAKVLSLLHTRSLKMEESILAVKVSPNNKFLAVALIDSTVKIFFIDTLKFFLSLYGHKLPVLCLDISYDSTLIATGSADRNVKIWGLDFGDCHKSMFAHDDSVTSLQFVPNTHQFFTCGKDGKVKQWDADTFKKVITLPGHHGEAWSLAVSANGQYVVSSGSDKVLRVWERSSEPLVLEDQEEEERAEEDENSLATGAQTTIPGLPGHGLPSKKTVGSEKSAELLLEALEECCKYKEQLDEYKLLIQQSDKNIVPPTVPLLMTAYQTKTIEEFLVVVLNKIRSSDLEEALLLLPFSAVSQLLSFLVGVLERGLETELVCRSTMFLLRVHHGPIVSNHALLDVITKLEKLVLRRVNEFRDMIGYNFHGLQFLQREIEMREEVQLFYEATQSRREKQKLKKKKERALKRALMTL